MKESLRLLGVEDSGLEDPSYTEKYKKNDDEIVEEVHKLTSVSEKENYLRKFLEKKPFGYAKSKQVLAEILKLKDPQYACELILSACQSSPIDPLNYLLFTEIAVENNALQVAKATLEVFKWISLDEYKDKANKLEKTISEKLLNKETDNSKDNLWYNKQIDKYWILERLYFQAKLKKLSFYAFRLLELFPENLANYYVAYKALSVLASKQEMMKFVEYVNKYLSSDVVNKNLYLGLAYHSLNEFKDSTSYLLEALKKDPLNSRALFYLAINYLVDGNIIDFIKSSERILPQSEAAFIALYFIYSALAGVAMDKKEFPNQKNISRELSLILEKLIKNNQVSTVKNVIAQIKKLDYFLVLPFLPLYLSEMLIRQNDLDSAFDLLEDSKDSEVHRLRAWIYRIKKNDNLAEAELAKYKKDYISNKETGLHCQYISLDLPDSAPSEKNEIFKMLENAFEQTNKFIQKMDLEYGLNAMTCVETSCQDCCRKTFPYVSYTEYLYMKEWLDNQSDDFKNKILKGSREIVDLYKKKYGKEAPFISDENPDLNKEYPLDFVFECPYLGDNKCNVYNARPFTCRAYSYGSQDGIRYKGCNYFFEQLKSATKLSEVRKVINMASFSDFAKLTDKQLIGKRIIAPIPVWFAQSHEETLEKINKAIS